MLDIPRVAEMADNHRTAALWVEVLQIAVLVVLAVLIGQRVSAETRLREQADAARPGPSARRGALQDMFESNLSPILIVDSDGYVVESNRAADRAFGSTVGDSGRPTTGGTLPRLVDVVGRGCGGSRARPAGVERRSRGSDLRTDPTASGERTGADVEDGR